jgi:uncharacterized protein (TIGR02145 family)
MKLKDLSLVRLKLLLKLVVLLFLNLCLNLSLSLNLFSQGVSINITEAAADNSAILDISSTSQGLLIPRMTTIERNNISSPATSLLIFNTSTDCFEAYVNGNWYSVSCPACPLPSAPIPGTCYGINNSPWKTQIIWNWSDISNPVSYKYGTNPSYSSATDAGTGTSYTQNGLTCNSSETLYVWAYNGCGNSDYAALTKTTSSCSSFKCGDTLTDSRDGKKYNTVQIGTQCWFQNNLQTTKYSNGDSIPNVIGYSTWSNLNSGAWCDFNNDANSGITYGHLYNWYAATDCRGICPTGWYIASLNDWNKLINYLGGINTAGGKLVSKEAGGNNSSGFSIILAGNYNTIFSAQGYSDNFWISTEQDSANAWANYECCCGNSNAYLTYFPKTYGFSIRCLMYDY